MPKPGRKSQCISGHLTQGISMADWVQGRAQEHCTCYLFWAQIHIFWAVKHLSKLGKIESVSRARMPMRTVILMGFRMVILIASKVWEFVCYLLRKNTRKVSLPIMWYVCYWNHLDVFCTLLNKNVLFCCCKLIYHPMKIYN